MRWRDRLDAERPPTICPRSAGRGSPPLPLQPQHSDNAYAKKHAAKESQKDFCLHPAPGSWPAAGHNFMNMKMDMVIQEILFGHYLCSVPSQK